MIVLKNPYFYFNPKIPYSTSHSKKDSLRENQTKNKNKMYRYPKSTLAGILFLYAILATSCRENTAAPIPPQAEVDVSYSSVAAPEEQATLHTDTVYQYEFRTGESGNYKYNYDVIGTDDLGNPITGNVSMQDKYGVGVLTDEEGNAIEVTLEWVGYGELMAEDEEGNVWELGVE